MDVARSLALGAIALIVTGFLVVAAMHYFSPAARLERRRRRSHTRVVTKLRKPSVALRVRTKKRR